MKWYLKVLNQYADFSGRARRTEYWMFVLFNIIFAVLAMILDNLLGLTIEGLPYGFIYFIYLVFVFIPGLAVVVRRLHDTGKSGWMILLSLIPVVGSIWLLVLMIQEGDAAENAYGPNPKGSDAGRSRASLSHEDNVLDSPFTSEASESSSLNTGMVPADMSDLIILLAIIWMTISRLIWFVIPRIAEEFYTASWFPLFNGLTTFIWACVPLGLAFVIKHPTKRLAMFILGGLYLIFGLVEVGYNIFG